MAEIKLLGISCQQLTFCRSNVSALMHAAFVALLVVMYVAIKMLTIRRSGTDKQRNSARHMLWRKVVTIVTTLYTVGAIFFVRSFLRPFDCVDDGRGRMFMESAPEIECLEDHDSEQGSTYANVKHLATVGMLAFASGFAFLCACLVKAHNTGNHSLGSLSFLGGTSALHLLYTSSSQTLSKRTRPTVDYLTVCCSTWRMTSMIICSQTSTKISTTSGRWSSSFASVCSLQSSCSSTRFWRCCWQRRSPWSRSASTSQPVPSKTQARTGRRYYPWQHSCFCSLLDRSSRCW